MKAISTLPRHQRYRQRHRERIRAKAREAYWNDPQKQRDRVADYRRRNPDRQQIDYRNNRDKVSVRSIDKRAKRLGIPDILDADIIKLIYRRQRDCCAHCGSNLDDGYVIDHKIAMRLGGSNIATNIQILCPECDKTKTIADNREIRIMKTGRLPLAELAQQHGLSKSTLRRRLAMGWKLQDALTRPLQRHRRR